MTICKYSTLLGVRTTTFRLSSRRILITGVNVKHTCTCMHPSPGITCLIFSFLLPPFSNILFPCLFSFIHPRRKSGLTWDMLFILLSIPFLYLSLPIISSSTLHEYFHSPPLQPSTHTRAMLTPRRECRIPFSLCAARTTLWTV